MARTKVFDLSCRGIDVYNIPKLLGVDAANVLAEWYPDPRGAGSFYDISGNGRHLAATGAPPVVRSTIVGQDGNLLTAFSYDGASTLHSLADASWMGVSDGDFSISAFVQVPSSNPGAAVYFFTHGSYQDDGILLGMSTGGILVTYLSKAGANVTASAAAASVDGLWHVVHVVRNSNYLTLYLDGVPGAPVDATGYGIDAARTLTIGCRSGPVSYWPNDVSYLRWQNNALTYTQITREVAAFKGILASRGGTNKYAVPTFTRSTTSYANKKASPTQFHQVPANWPVKTSDGAVLIEGAVTPLATYTGAYTSGADKWTFTRASMNTTSVTLPDGSTSTTAAFKEGVAGDGDTTHFVTHPLSCTSGSSYCVSKYFKYNPAAGTPREWAALVVSDGTNTKQVSFNVRYKYVGTAAGSLTGGYGIDPWEDGWVRCWVWATAGATAAGTGGAYICNADNDTDFVGADQDSMFMCWPQFESGCFPTLYQPNPTTGATRSGDFMAFCPFNITKDLAIAGQTPRLLFNGSESLNGATVTPTTGAYSFTKNGRPQNITSEAEGAAFAMNGTTDYLSLADTGVGDPFRPAGDFSIVASYTPNTVSGVTTIASKWNSVGDKRGWLLQQSAMAIYFTRSINGTSGLEAVTGACLETGRPVLITASFSTSTGMFVRVDAFSPTTTEGTTTATNGSDAALNIGATGTPSSYCNGRLHYLAYYDGYAATASDHSTNYARFKKDGILPLTMSSSTPWTKLICEFEIKNIFDIEYTTGMNRRMFTIGGGDWDTNLLYLVKNSQAQGNQVAFGLYTNTDTTNRYMRTGVITIGNCWRSHRIVTDCTNLALSTFHFDGTAMSDFGQMTGTAVFSLKDALIRIGQLYNGSPQANSYFRNVKLFVE